LVGVPDSTMKHFIDQGLKKNKILIDESKSTVDQMTLPCPVCSTILQFKSRV